MKVLNFLEWFAKHHKPNNVFECDNIYTFYSQPFKPEMISELFKGWDKHERGYYYLTGTGIRVYSSIKFTIDKLTGDSTQGELVEWTTFLETLTLPNTLNDFISDCQRAGIELTFKPEIVNKYFGVN